MVACIAAETSSYIEERAVGYRVFVIVSIDQLAQLSVGESSGNPSKGRPRAMSDIPAVVGVDLPSQSSATSGSIPPWRLSIEHGLSQS